MKNKNASILFLCLVTFAAAGFGQGDARRDFATDAQTRDATSRPASTDDSAPSGLVVVRNVTNSPEKDRALEEQALKNPFITGVGFQIHWSDLEPVEGKPDWSKLDELFAAAEKSRKWVQLCIYPGFFAPAWALEGVKTEQFAIQYGPGKGTVMSLPMPWNTLYLNRWLAFLKLLSDRYGKSPAFKIIAADGPTSVSEEMTLPRDPKKWQNDAYTPSKLIGAWQKVFLAYATDFPNQFISLAVGDTFNINDQGKIAPGEGVRTRQTIIDQAMSLLGRRFVLENHNLFAGPKNQDDPTFFVMSYSGRIITGLEMRSSAELGSAGQGAEGNPPLALRRSIDKGMEPNSAGQHVNYLEIYEPDVLADEMQPVLRYGASLFAPKKDSQNVRSPSELGAERRGAGEGSSSSENHDSQANRLGPRRASTDDSAPGGLVVVIVDKPQKDQSLDLRAVDNPSISGVALQIHWSDIEPVEGKPDWRKLDELFAAAEKSKKWVQLLIFPGFFSPAWALEGVKTEQFPIQYGPGNGTVMSLPMPWNTVYLNRWFAFLKLLSDRYGKSPAFRVIGAAGPTSVSVEMSLPQRPVDLKTWQNDGYTPGKYTEAYRKAFQVYATDFPDQDVSLSLGIGLNINDQGQRAPGEGMRTRQTIIDQAMGLLGRRFVLQNSDLHAGPKNQLPATPFVMSYSGRILTGLQIKCAAELGTCCAALGAEGNPPLALRKSIEFGMKPNSAGQHVNYLEIYEADVLADEMQPVLRDAASLFAPK